MDYEGDYDKKDKVKYLNYLTGIANRYLKDKKDWPVVCMVVIYTGDIKREQLSEEYDIGAFRMHVESAFLSELDSTGTQERLGQKVERNEMLDDEELMEFIILPLSCRTKEEKQQKSVKRWNWQPGSGSVRKKLARHAKQSGVSLPEYVEYALWLSHLPICG